MRDKVDITYVTPIVGAFTKPRATKDVGWIAERKNINIIPDFNIMEVNNEDKKIIDFAGLEVAFDCLVSVPTNMGDPMIERSGMGDDLNFVPTDKYTLQANRAENIFVIGDAANIPTSKSWFGCSRPIFWRRICYAPSKAARLRQNLMDMLTVTSKQVMEKVLWSILIMIQNLFRVHSHSQVLAHSDYWKYPEWTIMVN